MNEGWIIQIIAVSSCLNSVLLIMIAIAVTNAAWAAGEIPPVATLVYEVDSEQARACPDESSFRTMVVGRIGRDPFVATKQAEKGFILRVKKKGAGLEANLRINDVHGKPIDRHFVERLDRCDDLLEAVATTVAIAIDPLASPAAIPTPKPLPSKLDEHPQVTPAPTKYELNPSQTPSTPWKLQGHAAFGLSFGLAPGTMVGGEIGVGLARDYFVIRLEGRGETQPSPASQRGIDLEATLLSGALVPCFRYDWFHACAVGRVGVLQGRSPSVEHPSLGSSIVGSLGLRAALSVPLGSVFRITPRAELVVPLVRTTLLVNASPAWTAPAIGGHFGLEVGLSTP